VALRTHTQEMRRQRGSVIRRVSGTYAIKYRIAPGGKQKWEGEFATEEEAQDRLDAVLRELRTGEYVEPRIVTFANFAEEGIASRKSIRGSNSVRISLSHPQPFDSALRHDARGRNSPRKRRKPGEQTGRHGSIENVA